jgi:hypothetical protein
MRQNGSSNRRTSTLPFIMASIATRASKLASTMERGAKKVFQQHHQAKRHLHRQENK